MNNDCRCLNRRLVNAILASTIAWRAVPSFLSERPDVQHSFRYLLLSLFGDLPSACAIGAACLRSLPPETSTAEQHENEILASVSLDAETMKNREALRRKIANCVRHDFAEGAIINVDGWLLSLTEAHVYALVTLSLLNTH